MSSIRTLLVMLLSVGAIACGADSIAPSASALVGRWSLIPGGVHVRTLEFTADGRFVRTDAFRDVYLQLPTDSAGSIQRVYGAYVVHDDTLRFAQDSVRSWDYLGGSSFRIGPDLYFEGPPTDPAMELTPTHLTLRYMVDPGNGYVPVVDEYVRE